MRSVRTVPEFLIVSEQEIDEFQASLAAAGSGGIVPDTVDGVVIVANGVVQVILVGGQTGKFEIDFRPEARDPRD